MASRFSFTNPHLTNVRIATAMISRQGNLDLWVILPDRSFVNIQAAAFGCECHYSPAETFFAGLATSDGQTATNVCFIPQPDGHGFREFD
jgi:hypothetical protein